MRIGIVSDSHDRVEALRVAVAALSAEADVLLHAGDLCAPFIVPMLAEFAGPVHVVFGNNDADRFRMQGLASRFDHVTLHGEAFLGDLEGTSVAMQHFPELAQPLAESGRFDLVVYGHDHVASHAHVGRAWVINPGSLLGYQPGAGRHVPPTFARLDTAPGVLSLGEIVEGRASLRAPDDGESGRR
jgi:hypothetical protein